MGAKESKKKKTSVNAIASMGKNDANYVPLSPISFIQRAAAVHKSSPAYVFEETERTWGEAYERCQKITAALKSKYGIGLNDVCAVFSRNVPEMFELHYAIPMTQGVILTMNTRLDAPLIRYCLENSEAKVLFADNLNPEAVAEAVKGLDVKVINLHDASHEMADCHYNDLLEIGDPSTLSNVLPADEWQPIALSYTSGTTAKPKGVIYHHRGAYLMGSLSVPAWNLTRGLTYLYLVPMFHCNGWGFPWTSAVLGAKLVLLNNTGLNAKKIFDLIVKHKVTHFGGAPIVLNMLLNDPNPPQLDWTVQVMTAGAPPTPTTLSGMKKLGMEVMQVYGLTETYGHISHCLPQDSWGLLDADAIAEEQAKQGVCYPHTQGMEVWDKNGKPVPADGETMGEVVIRGNCVMAGYLKNPEANKKAFVGGWFHSGDLAVMHPDGYMQIKDREKDIIISGGENISSVEVQACLCKHPAILNAAVVAKPHPKWGETPCAFLELKSGAEQPSIEQLKEHCKNNMARFKCPGEFRFMDLPRTATGKIQKYVLRDQVKKEAAEKSDETSETTVKKELEQKAEDSTKEDTSNKVG